MTKQYIAPISRILTNSLALVGVLALIVVSNATADEDAWTADFRIGGCGGIYFLAEAGEFWVEVEKQDLNVKGRETHVRAILFGPDRSVLKEETLPFMGMEKGAGTGPVQRIKFTTEVPRKGIYGLNITASDDRYGQDIVWGIRTNCPRYLVETARGHKDEQHQEPLVLKNGDQPGTVSFLPQTKEISLSVAGFSVQTLRLLDSTGSEISSLSVGEDGTASLIVAADDGRENVPWLLEMTRAQGTVNIDGVTRWENKMGANANLSLWTPKISAWFPFHENRWLITPYGQHIDVATETSGEVGFEIHNNGPDTRSFELAIEFPSSDTWPAELSTNELELAPGQAETISLRFQVPTLGDNWTCHVRATPQDGSGFSTYASVDLRRPSEQSMKPLPMPIVLKPYAHENEQFGYRPDYPRTNQVYFDNENAPVILGDDHVSFLRDGQWDRVGQSTRNDDSKASVSLLTSKVAFDSDNDYYTLGKKDGTPVLLHGASASNWTSYPIPGKGDFDIEQFSGHNMPQGPPPFVRFTRTANDPKLKWRRVNDLSLFLPEKREDGTINIGDPILLSTKCIGNSSHSGIPSAIVSRDSKVHIVWGEATDPKKEVPGVPVYVATYDREKKALGTPALVGYGPPANDVHNTPCITMDSQGFLHVIIGTHGYPFKYTRSVKPNDASGGWLPAAYLGEKLHQTYIGLVCGPDDTLHLVFRLWRTDTEYFPAKIYATLAYMKKPVNGPWSKPDILLAPPFSEYSVFYHRLTIDRKGALFLSYDYWSTYWFYRTDRRETRRALITSATGGDAWNLVGSRDWSK